MSPATTPAASGSTPQTRCTHTRLHIRSAHEAHTLFEAVRLGLLPIVRRRLSPTDRELESGEVFVWEEASYKGGLERWTDGKKWSQSRMREPFLFYEEKAMPSREEREAKIARRACRSLGSPDTPPPIPSSPSSRRRDRPSKLRGLTKQTYSAYVTAENGGPAKKWHLTAYFCGTNYHELPVVADDPILRNIVVPKGIYVTGKGLTRNQRRTGQDSSTPVLPPSPTSSPPNVMEVEMEEASSSSSPSFTNTKMRDSVPPSSESSVTTAPLTDDGSQSPWSMSSLDPLPETPPLQCSSSSSSWRHPGSGPSPSPTSPYSSHHSHSHSSSASSSSSSYHPTPGYAYHAPQPTYPNPSGHYRQFMTESESPAVPVAPAPVVYEANPSLTSLHRSNSSYISGSPTYAAAQASPQDKYMYTPSPTYRQQQQHPSYSAPVTPSTYSYPPPPPQHQYPFPQQVSPPASYTGYPSSDVRGTHHQPTLPSPSLKSPLPTPTSSQFASPASSASTLRYSARHTLDQRALGAFRVQL
ncbi:hypothetical protein FRB96_001356 [Tulasnella sp. 330]|nr:hypothetical protein FRB96_001356 [Tulasnella sp. 330]KAG8873566.1 hypothetical protein FRB98_008906 [Tulasnella sp. 332]KAG8878520.1 hypothetical protein FRB97_002430 [Tulasnella sp. 331]